MVFVLSGIKTPPRHSPQLRASPPLLPSLMVVGPGRWCCLPSCPWCRSTVQLPLTSPLIFYRSSGGGGFHPQALHAPALPLCPPNQQLAHGKLLTAL